MFGVVPKAHIELAHGELSPVSKVSFLEVIYCEYQAGRGVSLQPCDWVVPGAHSLLVSLHRRVEQALFGPYPEEGWCVGLTTPRVSMLLPSPDPCLWPLSSSPDFGLSLVSCWLVSHYQMRETEQHPTLLFLAMTGLGCLVVRNP